MKKFYIFIICLISLFILSGCSKNKVVGIWEYVSSANYYYTFNEDKTCTYTIGDMVLNGSYEDDKTRITILFDGVTDAIVYEYVIKDDILTLTNSLGSKMSFKKK